MDIYNSLSLFVLWQQLSEFVEESCKGRDPSHGHSHMLTVVLNALKILEAEKNTISKEYQEKILKYVMIVAWLHDVADYKYDKDGILKNKVFKFLKSIVSEDETILIIKIIDHISYSKENKAIVSGTPINFYEILGDIGTTVRDIVSDADKLEALGKIGFDRCVEYQKHYYKEKHNSDIPYDWLKKKVHEHSNEKLLRLKDEFMRTNYGKQMAKPLHDDLINELSKM